MQKKKQRKLDETITNNPIVIKPIYIKRNIKTIGVLESSLKDIYLHKKVNKSFYGEIKCDRYE